MNLPRCALLAALLSVAVPSAASAHPGSGIVVDRAGRVYFVTFDGIMRVDEQGRLIRFVRDDRIRIPHHLVIDADGNLYTVSDDDGKVWRISPAGRLTLFHERRGARAPQVGAGGDPFTLGADGSIYFVPESRRGIQRIRGDTVEIFSDTTFAFGDLHGSTMTWGPNGDLYVTDRTRVLKIAPNGEVSALNSGLTPAFALAMGIAVDSAARAYVADYAANRVVRISPESETTAFGRGRLLRPTGVALGPDGAVYVLDGRVWKIEADGGIALVACVTAIPESAEYAVALLVPLLLALWIALGRKSSLRDRILRIVLTGIVMTPLYFAARAGCSALEARYAVYAVLITAVLWSLVVRRASGAPPAQTVLPA